MQTVPITTSVVSSNLHTGEFVLNATPKCKKKGSNCFNSIYVRYASDIYVIQAQSDHERCLLQYDDVVSFGPTHWNIGLKVH
jgi:hypothetical protein